MEVEGRLYKFANDSIVIDRFLKEAGFYSHVTFFRVRFLDILFLIDNNNWYRHDVHSINQRFLRLSRKFMILSTSFFLSKFLTLLSEED